MTIENKQIPTWVNELHPLRQKEIKAYCEFSPKFYGEIRRATTEHEKTQLQKWACRWYVEQ